MQKENSMIYDQTLFGNHANQTDLNSRPTLRTAAEGNNNCYFMKFNSNQTMISYINLSAVSGQDDIVNVFIVFRLEANTTSHPANLINGLLVMIIEALIDLFVSLNSVIS